MLKRLRFPLFLLLSCLVFGAADCLSQSPVDGFFKGKDNLQLVVGTGAENNSKFEAGSGTISLPQTQIHFAVAGIYGINDRFDAVLSLPLVANGDQVGLQDGRLSLKYGLAEIEMDKSSLSFQLAASHFDRNSSYCPLYDKQWMVCHRSIHGGAEIRPHSKCDWRKL